MYTAAWRKTAYRFPDLKELMAKATPPRSGDVLAGVAATSAEENVAAKMAFADVPLKQFLTSRRSLRERRREPSHHRQPRPGGIRADLAHDRRRVPRLAALRGRDHRGAARLAPGITPEMAAATSKIMRNQDLILARAKAEVVTRFRDTIGLKGRMAGPAAAQSSDRRQARHRGVDRRRPDARVRRRRDRHQPGKRQRRRPSSICSPCSTTSSAASTFRRRAAC